MPRAQIKDEPMNSNIYLEVGLSPFRHQARESSESLGLLGVNSGRRTNQYAPVRDNMNPFS